MEANFQPNPERTSDIAASARATSWTSRIFVFRNTVRSTIRCPVFRIRADAGRTGWTTSARRAARPYRTSCHPATIG
jgi:hypothetical protein